MNFTFTLDQANRILNILAKEPYKDVADLITLLIDQGKEQETKEPQVSA